MRKPARGKSRTHQLVLTVVFYTPCSTSEAVRAANDCIYGDHYPAVDHGVDHFIVKRISRLPKGGAS